MLKVLHQEYGWCWTKSDHHDSKEPQSGIGGWGFCSKDCFLKNSITESGILRVADHVDVLAQEVCEKYLTNSLLYDDRVKYQPRVLCIGKIEQWSTDVWFKNGTTYQKVSAEQKERMIKRHHYAEYLGDGGYISIAGLGKEEPSGIMYEAETDPKSGKMTYIMTGELSPSNQN